jgi:hypothetical protein
MSERALGKITAMLADLGLEVTYAYDDLVFVQHSAFILQFTSDPGILNCYINTECEPVEADIVSGQIVTSFKTNGFQVVQKGSFNLSQNEDKTLRIEFS